MALTVGDKAPDFELTWKIGSEPLKRSTYQNGETLAVFFFPLAFSGVCTEEMCTLAEDLSAYSDLGARVVGISVDSPFVNAKFAAECGADFPILSDFNTDASEAFGVRNADFFGMNGVSDRSVFVIDGEGTVRYAWVGADPGIMPDFDEIKQAISAI
jgi:peroxiredoxin